MILNKISSVRPVRLVLFFSLVLFATGITWGLPNTVSWMADDLAPFHPVVGLGQAFSFGYYNKYPLVHQVILAVLNLPALLWAIFSHVTRDGFQLFQFLAYGRSAEFATVLTLIDRVVSVVMGVGIVYFIYRGAAELFGGKAGLWAALFVSLNAILNYYSHLSKVEVPYVFWAVLGLYSLVKVVKYDRRADYVYTALFACLSFGTKDQGYAIFVIPFLFYLVLLPSALPEGRRNGRLRAVSQKYPCIRPLHGLVHAPRGKCVSELRRSRGTFSVSHRGRGKRSIGYAFDVTGMAALLYDVAHKMAFEAMGVPAFVLAVLGIGLAAYDFRSDRRRLALAQVYCLAALSYHLFFVQLIRQSSVRFAFPQSVFLAVYAGYAVSRFFESAGENRQRRMAGGVLLCAVLAFSLYNTLSVNMNMLCDARYAAERWMEKNVPSNATIEYYTYLHYLPRFPSRALSYRVKEDIADIERRRPDFVVLNSTMIAKYDARKTARGAARPGRVTSLRQIRRGRSEFPEFLNRLLGDELNYRKAFQSDLRVPFFRNMRALNISSEYIVIYRRVRPSGGLGP